MNIKVYLARLGDRDLEVLRNLAMSRMCRFNRTGVFPGRVFTSSTWRGQSSVSMGGGLSHVRTDLVEADGSIGCQDDGFRCFFKLETQQASGSFKDRGMFHMVQHTSGGGSQDADNNVTMLVSSSGGNAGNAVATVGKMLNIPVEVFVPTTTMELMVRKIKSKGAEVTIGGENWNEADERARKAVKEAPGALYCPPFDNPLIWKGNSSIVDEIAMQMNKFSLYESHGVAFPDAIILSVGGGGLLRGVQMGLEKLGMDKTKIIAVETEGAASFASAPDRLTSIDSVATSLGSLYVVEDALRSPIETISMVVSDEDAIDACFQYAQDYRTLVEPACGASLAALSTKHRDVLKAMGIKSCVVIVCGGSAVSIDLLASYRDRIKA